MEDNLWNLLRPLFLEIKGWKSAKVFAKTSLRFSPVSGKKFAWISLSGISFITKWCRPYNAPSLSRSSRLQLHPRCGLQVRNFLCQERQGVPARWGDPARGIPTVKPPTLQESHEPGPPLEPRGTPCPFPKRCRRAGGVPGPGSKGGKGPGSWYSSTYTGSRGAGIPRAGSPQRAGTPRRNSHFGKFKGPICSKTLEKAADHSWLFWAAANGGKFSPFFSAKGVVKFGVKFWWNFPCYVFQGLGVRRKISPKFHVKNGVKNRKFHANFTLLGRSAVPMLGYHSSRNHYKLSSRNTTTVTAIQIKFPILVRTRRIGANPKKPDLVNLQGPD